MTIRNNIEYALWSPAQSAHVQHAATICRPRKLTYRGAERIIRRDYPAAIVTMVRAAAMERRA